jgi:hypothetical protein
MKQHEHIPRRRGEVRIYWYLIVNNMLKAEDKLSVKNHLVFILINVK